MRSLNSRLKFPSKFKVGQNTRNTNANRQQELL